MDHLHWDQIGVEDKQIVPSNLHCHLRPLSALLLPRQAGYVSFDCISLFSRALELIPPNPWTLVAFRQVVTRKISASFPFYCLHSSLKSAVDVCSGRLLILRPRVSAPIGAYERLAASTRPDYRSTSPGAVSRSDQYPYNFALLLLHESLHG